MLLRIYWIEQTAFLNTSQATISALKKGVNLMHAMLHCVRALTFEKTISTSTTKYKCRCELGKTKQDLATPLREISPTQILIILLISNILRCFDRVFRRPYRYFLFHSSKKEILPLSDRFEVFTTDDHWLILDWIAVINCLIKKF